MHDGEKLIDERWSVCLRKGVVSNYSTSPSVPLERIVTYSLLENLLDFQ